MFGPNNILTVLLFLQLCCGTCHDSIRKNKREKQKVISNNEGCWLPENIKYKVSEIF